MNFDFDMKSCSLCPRKCRADRTKVFGVCGQSERIKIARYSLHLWEEPCISGKRGSGTVFFSSCSLRCCFCQNFEISQLGKGFEISAERLADIFLELEEKGAHNINLVNPTHFAPQIIKALESVRHKLLIPVVYNSGGYERAETIRAFDGLADIFLPDLKFFDPVLSEKYCRAENYFEYAITAIEQMQKITGDVQLDETGMMKRGTMVRHLVMPNQRFDSIRVLDELYKLFGQNSKQNPKIFLSLMSQYFPAYNAGNFKEINRRTSTFEYNFVLKHAQKLGFTGFMQERASADEIYVPQFFSNESENFV